MANKKARQNARSRDRRIEERQERRSTKAQLSDLTRQPRTRDSGGRYDDGGDDNSESFSDSLLDSQGSQKRVDDHDEE